MPVGLSLRSPRLPSTPAPSRVPSPAPAVQESAFTPPAPRRGWLDGHSVLSAAWWPVRSSVANAIMSKGEQGRLADVASLINDYKFEPHDLPVHDDAGRKLGTVRLYHWNRARAEALVGPDATAEQRRLAGLETREVKAGERDPLLVLHGIFCNAVSHKKMLDPLREDHDEVVLIDLPGHGDTQLEPGVNLDPAVMGTLVEKALRAFFGDRPFGIYGNSLGGAVTLEMTDRFGEQVTSAFVANPVGGRASEEVQRAFFGGLQPRSFGSLYNDRDRFFDHSGPVTWKVFAHHLLGSMVAEQLMAKGPLREFISHGGNDSAIRPEQLERIASKTAYLRGPNDKLVPAEVDAYFKEHLGGNGATVLEPEGFGHAPGLKRPLETARLVRAHEDAVRESKATGG
jgi:pimeloyl-ACP methyl ester carboxylesterase